MQTKMTIDHEPIGQPRPRAVRRGYSIGMYTPTTHAVTSFKRMIVMAWKQVNGRSQYSGPIAVWIHAWFSRPKRMVYKRKQMHEHWHVTKPDADNIAKAVLDALNGVAWKDDAQVCAVHVVKRVRSDASPGRVDITIEELSNEQ